VPKASKTAKSAPKASLKQQPGRWLKEMPARLWRGSIWRKIFLCLAAILILFTTAMYGVAEWYIHKHENQPLILGTTFIPSYAESYGLDPHQTLKAILGDLNMKQVRLVSYWEDVEPTPGTYNFSELDWQFAMANQYHAKVSLAIGLRQPRWPECHQPGWVASEPKNVWEPQLNSFMKAVINRYKNNPALQDYELENEYFLKVFGTCTDFERSRLVNEFEMVKQTDPNHPVIVSRSDNWVGIPVGKPTPDLFAISVYKRVWDATITHRYFEYPLPPWFYAALAGSEELLSGKDMIIHELQTEPWPPKGQDVVNAPLSEQFKSMDAKRLQQRIQYGEDTGMRTIDLWGAEWWYWLMVDKHDSSVWNTVKQAVAQADAQNQQLAAKNSQN